MSEQFNAKRYTDKVSEELTDKDFVIMVRDGESTYFKGYFDFHTGLRMICCLVDSFMNTFVPHISYRLVVSSIRNAVNNAISSNEALPNNEAERAARKLERYLSKQK